MARYQEEDTRRRRVIEFDWRTSARRDHGLIKGNPIRAPEALQVTLSEGRMARLSKFVPVRDLRGYACWNPA